VPLHFIALQVQLSVVLANAFVMDSTVWPVSCLLCHSWCPRDQPFVKMEDTFPRVICSRRHCWFISSTDYVSIMFFFNFRSRMWPSFVCFRQNT